MVAAVVVVEAIVFAAVVVSHVGEVVVVGSVVLRVGASSHESQCAGQRLHTLSSLPIELLGSQYDFGTLWHEVNLCVQVTQHTRSVVTPRAVRS